ncbi:MAG: hypothetical protein GY849_00695 [Deltaproteobacteria bacterium]|nr:hypothetical protein [Deltaproteobacteria bacterium]
MKKYLVVRQIDVADEGEVGMVKVITEKKLNDTKSIETGFGNIEGSIYKFDKSSAVEITEKEYAVLEKFGLTSLEFGYCHLSYEDPEDYE